MDCTQLHLCIDDYLDGILPAGEQQLAKQHLADCEACRTELDQIQALRHALRSLPVPPSSADFANRAFAKARQSRQQSQRLIGGLSTALAASLLIWLGVAQFQTGTTPSGIETIAMGISDTREVKLVFNAPEAFQNVTLKLELSGNIELSGYSGRNNIKWKTALKKGSNSLVLPITATGDGQAEVVARLIHQGKTRTFRIPIEVYNSGAYFQSIHVPVST